MVAKVNYLNNRDILREINKSKISYSSFIDEKYQDFDIIVDNVGEITEEKIEEAKKLKSAKSAQDGYHDATKGPGPKAKVKPKQKDFFVGPESYTKEDIVFRVMTYEHIPDEPDRKKTPKTIADTKARVNFPAFKHYAFIDDELVEVGRSHWRDGLQNGCFDVTHGQMTNKLGTMFSELVRRFGFKGNWRGYCVDTETEALTQRGWLNIDEINSNDIVLSCNENRQLTWSKICDLYRGEYTGLMHYVTNKQGLNMLVTPNHKLVTNNGHRPMELIRDSDQIFLMGAAEQGANTPVHSDAFVELAGWIVTKGCYERDHAENLKRICIWQNKGPHADRIRACLTSLNYKFTENSEKCICFAISRSDSREFEKIFTEKNLHMEFLLSLTKSQRQLLYQTLIDGNGWQRGQQASYAQKDVTHVAMFQALTTLLGRRSSARLNDIVSFNKPTQCHTINVFSDKRNQTRAKNLNFNGGKRSNATQIGLGKEHHPNEPTVEYDGRVWCVQTDHGSFVVRRNGHVHLTGNTYNDEMQGQALMQLAQVGLQFNEAKSDNPFAYYTATVSNSFTRVLNTEKKNQKIKDELRMANGHLPSMSRQLDHEQEINELRASANDETNSVEKIDIGRDD